ncbi:MAG TPA: DUF6644 family protein [Gemmatimonadota bacterium]|nr:DUF6644 family protein [Gemmatimonadota bacterium]
MSLLGFCEWLAETRLSIALHESLWGYPLVESTHVWALALFVGFAALLDLRLLGVALRGVPVSEVARRLLPWTRAGFVIMVVTGVLLFYAIPVRSYQNVFFRLKMILLVLAGLNAFLFHAGIFKRVTAWDREIPPPRRARMAGAASLVLWASIIFAGRMIAYNWFDCDRQPQPAWVNWAAGCVVEPEV